MDISHQDPFTQRIASFLFTGLSFKVEPPPNTSPCTTIATSKPPSITPFIPIVPIHIKQWLFSQKEIVELWGQTLLEEHRDRVRVIINYCIERPQDIDELCLNLKFLRKMQSFFQCCMHDLCQFMQEEHLLTPQVTKAPTIIICDRKIARLLQALHKKETKTRLQSRPTTAICFPRMQRHRFVKMQCKFLSPNSSSTLILHLYL